MAQLQVYYGAGDESQLKYELLGVNLLRLLALDRIAEFHTELELIAPARRTSEPCVQYPVVMEQNLMEGAFHRALQDTTRAPSPLFSLFAGMLGQTVRTQIAECVARAYSTLSTKEVAALLMLSGANADEQLKQFEAQFDWVRGPHHTYDFSKARARAAADLRVPKVEVMNQALAYATELERIV